MPALSQTDPIAMPRFLRIALQRWARRRQRRMARLDMAALPDHLARDIGLLDGNDPRGRRCR